MKLELSCLDITLDEATGQLTFGEGVLCDGGSDKALGQMEGLYADMSGCDLVQRVYWAYRNIRRVSDDALWVPRGLRYDITVLLPGDAKGELFKTSGHYHGLDQGMALPYPEVYEVLCGEVAFVLQKSPALLADGCGAEPVDAVRVLDVHAGEAIVIPPFWGHGSINVSDGPSAFSNIAVVDTPLLYGPVHERRGLAVRVTRMGDGWGVAANEAWQPVANTRTLRPHEAPELGIIADVPCYEAYVADPSRFDYLRASQHSVAHMEELLEV